MKILIFSKSTWNIVNFRKNLIKKLLAQGFEIYILSSIDASEKKLIEMGCKIFPLKIRNKQTNIFFDILLLFKILKVYKLIKPNIILNFNIKPVIYGSLIARLLRIPNINMITGLGTVFIANNFLTKIVKYLYYISLKKTNMVFFQNLDDRKYFLDNNLVHKDLTNLIPGSGIDTKHYKLSKYPENQTITFLLISRILWDKGIKEYIDAARFFKLKYHNVNFQLLGPVEKEVKSEISLEQIKLWEKEKLIDYLGFCEDVRPFIQKSHCVVLPSYREGTPKSLLEASSMGRPIIATDTVGCREVVENNINGYLCINKNSLSLIKSMERFMLLSLEEKISMGIKGRIKVEKEFDEKFVIDSYLDVINKIKINLYEK